MNNVVTYESFHKSAKNVASEISKKLNCKCINIDTPFEIEDLKEVKNLILVFNFRGPYTAQFTKLYLSRVKEQLKDVNIFLVGEGLFSEQEFPKVADEINKSFPSRSFSKYFIKGQLRVDILFPEEKALLAKFSEITKIEIKDMGNLDYDMISSVCDSIYTTINNDNYEKKKESNENKTKWVCPVCGYIHYADNPPEVCPLCGVSGNKFIKEK